MEQALSAGWRFLEHSPQSFNPAELSLPDPDSGPWSPVRVPGDVNQACVELGRMPSPHTDTQARKCYWVTSREWWYACRFDAPAFRENLELAFAAVDGPADLWLNGRYLGLMDNVHRPWTFEIGKSVRPAANLVLLRFRSIDALLGGPRLDETAGWKSRRAFLRKPQYNLGWDWALPLPSLGLSGPVALRADNLMRFKEAALRPFCSGRVDFFFEVSREARDAGYEIEVRVKGHGAALRARIPGAPRDAYTGHGADGGGEKAARFKSYVSLKIPRPRLWWPNGFGVPALYDWEAILRAGGRPVDSRRGKLGLREVEIIEEPFRKGSGPGFSFAFRVNGAPVFIKGANLCPMEIWPANATESQYRFTVDKCREAGFNMIRVWGGGIYERELFYDLCDRAGILVWQDFMFASAGVPLPLLRDSIIQEALHQIRRLRNRPCIAIWCGCNEDVFSWRHPETETRATQADEGAYSLEDDRWKVDRLKHDPELYTMLLRGLVSRLGMGVPYTESSPQSHDDAGNMPSSGNSHVSSHKYALIQSAEHPEAFRRHFDQACSFDSEFCIHGPAAVSSLRRFLAPENLWPPNEAWVYHMQRGHLDLPYHEQVFRIAGGVFGEMADIGTFVKHGQAMHLEEMRCEFESARRNRPDCGGTMFWMFNDCWPTSNWSVIDYYRTPKPAYYAAKRACAPVLPIILEKKGVIEFYLSNESPDAVRASFVYGAETLEGSRSRVKRKTFVLAANGLRRVDAILKKRNELPPGSFWFVRAEMDKRPLPAVTYFPDGWKDIAWPEPGASFRAGKAVKRGGRLVLPVKIRTRAFLRLGHLRLESGPADAWASDNYFDLPAGAAHTVAVESARPLDPAAIRLGHWLTAWD